MKNIFLDNKKETFTESVLDFSKIELSQDPSEQLREQLSRHEVKSIKNYNGSYKKLNESFYNDYQCPHCHAQVGISEDEVAENDGIVYCPYCEEVFDIYDCEDDEDIGTPIRERLFIDICHGSAAKATSYLKGAYDEVKEDPKFYDTVVVNGKMMPSRVFLSRCEAGDFGPLNEANRVYNFRIVIEQPEPAKFRMRKDAKFKTQEEAENQAAAWNLNMSKRAKDYGCKFVVEEIADKPRRKSPKTSDNPDFKNPFQVGDILVGDIGYTMQLPQFWEVTKVSPQYVTCTRLETKSVTGDGWQGECVPVEGCYSRRRNINGKVEPETAKMHVQKFGTSGEPYEDYSAWLNRRYRFEKWNGKSAHYDHMD